MVASPLVSPHLRAHARRSVRSGWRSVWNGVAACYMRRAKRTHGPGAAAAWRRCLRRCTRQINNVDLLDSASGCHSLGACKGGTPYPSPPPPVWTQKASRPPPREGPNGVSQVPSGWPAWPRLGTEAPRGVTHRHVFAACRKGVGIQGGVEAVASVREHLLTRRARSASGHGRAAGS